MRASRASTGEAVTMGTTPRGRPDLGLGVSGACVSREIRVEHESPDAVCDRVLGVHRTAHHYFQVAHGEPDRHRVRRRRGQG